MNYDMIKVTYLTNSVDWYMLIVNMSNRGNNSLKTALVVAIGITKIEKKNSGLIQNQPKSMKI